MFTPVADWNGEASFTFKVADQSDAESGDGDGDDHGDGGGRRAGGECDLTTSTAEDTALTFAAADFDGRVHATADTGDSLKAVQVVTLPAAAQGTLALGGSAVTANDVIARGSLGTLKFTPVANWNGDATFTFKVVDRRTRSRRRRRRR